MYTVLFHVLLVECSGVNLSADGTSSCSARCRLDGACSRGVLQYSLKVACEYVHARFFYMYVLQINFVTEVLAVFCLMFTYDLIEIIDKMKHLIVSVSMYRKTLVNESLQCSVV